MKRFLILLFVFLVCSANTWLYASGNEGLGVLRENYINDCVTDEELRALAVKMELVPEEIDDVYIKKQTEEGNTLIIWVVLDRKEKILIVSMLKDLLKEKEGAVIKGPSSYYADLINCIIYDSILEEYIDVRRGSGLKSILKVLAILEGDYNNGENREKLLRECIGDELAREYEERYPKVYEDQIGSGNGLFDRLKREFSR